MVRKAYVLVIAVLMAPALVTGAAAAFGFSFPFGTIVAGPGLAAAGPTTFNTYYHDATFANTAAAADAAVNGLGGGWPLGIPFAAGPCGVPYGGSYGFSPVPGCLPAIPFGFGPYGYGNVANSLAESSWGEDNTFATSFSTAGGVATGWPGLIGGNFAGAYPQFTLNFF